jgi:hypothetical protein
MVLVSKGVFLHLYSLQRRTFFHGWHLQQRRATKLPPLSCFSSRSARSSSAIYNVWSLLSTPRRSRRQRQPMYPVTLRPRRVSIPRMNLLPYFHPLPSLDVWLWYVLMKVWKGLLDRWISLHRSISSSRRSGISYQRSHLAFSYDSVLSHVLYIDKQSLTRLTN